MIKANDEKNISFKWHSAEENVQNSLQYETEAEIAKSNFGSFWMCEIIQAKERSDCVW